MASSPAPTPQKASSAACADEQSSRVSPAPKKRSLTTPPPAPRKRSKKFSSRDKLIEFLSNSPEQTPLWRIWKKLTLNKPLRSNEMDQLLPIARLIGIKAATWMLIESDTHGLFVGSYVNFSRYFTKKKKCDHVKAKLKEAYKGVNNPYANVKGLIALGDMAYIGNSAIHMFDREELE